MFFSMVLLNIYMNWLNSDLKYSGISIFAVRCMYMITVSIFLKKMWLTFYIPVKSGLYDGKIDERLIYQYSKTITFIQIFESILWHIFCKFFVLFCSILSKSQAHFHNPPHLLCLNSIQITIPNSIYSLLSLL